MLNTIRWQLDDAALDSDDDKKPMPAGGDQEPGDEMESQAVDRPTAG